MISQQTQQTTNHVPLTTRQKARLIADCLPFLAFIVIFFAVLTLFRGVVGVGITSIIFRLVIGLVLLVLGYQALQRLRDLISGRATVAVDVLERSWRASGGTRASYYGRFRQLGRMRLIPKAHVESHVGQPDFNQRYRITYSPKSKIVWTLERLN